MLTIGVFDGVHLGHQKLLSTTYTEATKRGYLSLVITFSAHPLALLAPPYAPKILTSPTKKLQLISQHHIDATLMLDFTADLAATEPEEFIKSCLFQSCKAQAIICGYDFTFGNRGRGDFALLKSHANQAGIDVLQEEAFSVNGVAVKSTHIRDLIFAGRIDAANDLLSRPYTMDGIVVPGHARGRTIGYPTANVRVADNVAVPAPGVYYCTATLGSRADVFTAMVNIGTSPTFGQNPQTIEAHILDFSDDIVNETLVLHFHKRLRDEVKFASVADLTAQLHRDESQVRSLANQ